MSEISCAVERPAGAETARAGALSRRPVPGSCRPGSAPGPGPAGPPGPAFSARGGPFGQRLDRPQVARTAVGAAAVHRPAQRLGAGLEHRAAVRAQRRPPRQPDSARPRAANARIAAAAGRSGFGQRGDPRVRPEVAGVRDRPGQVGRVPPAAEPVPAAGAAPPPGPGAGVRAPAGCRCSGRRSGRTGAATGRPAAAW